jgi:hypothetical protein
LDDTTAVDLRGLRLAGAAMLPIALVLPHLPIDPVPPCPLRTLTGIPCPLCGSTRGVVAAMHGHLAHAVSLNPASLLVIILAVAVLVFWRVRKVAIPVWVIVALFAVLWSYQLFKFTTGRPL